MADHSSGIDVAIANMQGRALNGSNLQDMASKSTRSGRDCERTPIARGGSFRAA